MANLEMEKLVLSGFDANTYTLTPDTTLAKSGVPADAKATGDQLSQLSADITVNSNAIGTLNNQLNALGFSVVDGALNVTYTEE